MKSPRKMDYADCRLGRFAGEIRIRAERRLGALLARPRPQRLAAMDGADFERLLGKWRLRSWRKAKT
jgi:hypothetical protein